MGTRKLSFLLDRPVYLMRRSFSAGTPAPLKQAKHNVRLSRKEEHKQ